MAVLVFPPNPSSGQTFTASNNIVYVYQSDKWTSIGAIVDTSPGSDAPTVSVGTNPPPNPPIGSLWYNTVRGILYVWYQDEDQTGVSGQWTDVRPPSTGS
jgi:hypothetical protein